MGCRHDYYHGCGPGYYWPVPRGFYPPDEYDWYDDVNWPLRRRHRERGERADALEMRLDELREEMRRIETALADLRRPASDESTP